MGFLLKGILAVFWLVIIPPFLSGLIPGSRGFSLPERFLSGYLLCFSLAEVLTLPAVFIRYPFHVLSDVFGVSLFLLALLGAWRIRRQKNHSLEKKGAARFSISAFFKKIPLSMWAAIILIVLQTAVVVLLGHRDQDDAFYVATATTTLRADSIFRVNCYTGYPYHSFPKRYVLSPFPIFLSLISRLCLSLHPAILAHVFFPAVFVPMAYLVFYLFAVRWYPDDPGLRGWFMLASALLVWFSAGSVYRSGVFLIVRSWQGKAVLAGVFLPLLFYLDLSFFTDIRTASSKKRQKADRGPCTWPLLFLAHLACCLLSSMGILLAPLMTGTFCIPALFGRHSRKRILPALFCMLPGLLLGVLYLML